LRKAGLEVDKIDVREDVEAFVDLSLNDKDVGMKKGPLAFRSF